MPPWLADMGVKWPLGISRPIGAQSGRAEAGRMRLVRNRGSNFEWRILHRALHSLQNPSHLGVQCHVLG
jgi:hypothetical protein